MFTQSIDIKVNLVRQFDLLNKMTEPLGRTDRDSRYGVFGNVGETVNTQFHGRQHFPLRLGTAPLLNEHDRKNEINKPHFMSDVE